MPIDHEFWDILPDTIIWERRTGTDAYSRPQFAAPEVIQHCRVQSEFRQAVDTEGQETLQTATIYIVNDVSVSGTSLLLMTPDDRITLGNGKQPRIIDINDESDESGLHHFIVQLGASGGSS